MGEGGQVGPQVTLEIVKCVASLTYSEIIKRRQCCCFLALTLLVTTVLLMKCLCAETVAKICLISFIVHKFVGMASSCHIKLPMGISSSRSDQDAAAVKKAESL